MPELKETEFDTEAFLANAGLRAKNRRSENRSRTFFFAREIPLTPSSTFKRGA